MSDDFFECSFFLHKKNKKSYILFIMFTYVIIDNGSVLRPSSGF